MAIELNKISFGDSLKMCELMEAKTVDLILEDMPYNTTACEWDVKIDLELYWKTRLRILKPTGVICLTASQPFTSKVVISNYKMFNYEIIWDKVIPTGHLNASFAPLKKHENILHFGSKKVFNPLPILREYKELRPNRKKSAEKRKTVYEKKNYGKHKVGFKEGNDFELKHPASIIEFGNGNGWLKRFNIHPTQKPVGLFEYLICTYTNEGDLVFDGFGGSGTTAIAAYKAKRNFIVIEKEQEYYDLSVKRLKNEMAQLRLL